MEQFIDVHRPQLVSSAIPQHYWASLYTKLATQTFDAGKLLYFYLTLRWWRWYLTCG